MWKSCCSFLHHPQLWLGCFEPTGSLFVQTLNSRRVPTVCCQEASLDENWAVWKLSTHPTSDSVCLWGTSELLCCVDFCEGAPWDSYLQHVESWFTALFWAFWVTQLDFEQKMQDLRTQKCWKFGTDEALGEETSEGRRVKRSSSCSEQLCSPDLIRLK